jgi:hypothetical protein
MLDLPCQHGKYPRPHRPFSELFSPSWPQDQGNSGWFQRAKALSLHFRLAISPVQSPFGGRRVDLLLYITLGIHTLLYRCLFIELNAWWWIPWELGAWLWELLDLACHDDSSPLSDISNSWLKSVPQKSSSKFQHQTSHYISSDLQNWSKLYPSL